MADPDFVDAVLSDPSAALAEYDLSQETVEAVESGDETRIRSALGRELAGGVPNQSPPNRA